MIALLAAGGCVPSPYLVQPDPARDEALALLAPSAKMEARSDELLFLQAETFHFYRPTTSPIWPSPQISLGFCLSSLPPIAWLSGIAGGDLGIFEIRRRAEAAAAQHYEELLRRSPEGPFAAKALWRLGFAYRNVQIGSLMFGGEFRRGSDECFDELERRYPESQEGKLAKLARRAPHQSLFLVKLLSAGLPGAGQMFCGEWKNGAVRLALATAAGLIFVGGITSYTRTGRAGAGAALIVGLFGVQVAWTSAIWDAERAAIAFNERIELEFHRRHRLR